MRAGRYPQSFVLSHSAFVFSLALLSACAGDFGLQEKPKFSFTEVVVKITSPEEGSVWASSIVVEGNCSEEAGTVEIHGDVDAGKEVSCDKGGFSGEVFLAGDDGVKEIVVSQEDEVGNVQEDSREFFLDSSLPQVTYEPSTLLKSLNDPIEVSLLASENVDFCTISEIPSWIQFDSETCQISGTAEALGSYEFEITPVNSAGKLGPAASINLEVYQLPEVAYEPNFTALSIGEETTVASFEVLTGVVDFESCEIAETGGLESSLVEVDDECDLHVQVPENIEEPDFQSFLISVRVANPAGGYAEQNAEFTLEVHELPEIAFDPNFLAVNTQGSFSADMTVSGGVINPLTCQLLIAPEGFDVSFDESCQLSGTAPESIDGTDETFTLAVSAENYAGSPITTNLVVEVHAQAFVEIEQPEEGAFLNGSPFQLTGACQSGFEVEVFGEELVESVVVPCETNSFEATIAFDTGFEDGPKLVEVKQQNFNDHEDIDERQFILSTTPPVLEIGSFAVENPTNNNEAQVVSMSGENVVSYRAKILFSEKPQQEPQEVANCDDVNFEGEPVYSIDENFELLLNQGDGYYWICGIGRSPADVWQEEPSLSENILILKQDSPQLTLLGDNPLEREACEAYEEPDPAYEVSDWYYSSDEILVSTTNEEGNNPTGFDSALHYTAIDPLENETTEIREISASAGEILELGDLDPENPDSIHNHLSKDFALCNDLDLSGFDHEPIGSIGSPFTGDFEGNNNTISNMQISGSSRVGLFSAVSGTQIKNLSLENLVVREGSRVGGLIGSVSESQAEVKISNVHISGEIYGGGSEAGGFIGEVDASVVSFTNSTFSGYVVGWLSGGLIGRVFDSSIVEVKNVATNSQIYSNTHSAGGLIGFVSVGNSSDIFIEESYSLGKVVTGTHSAGGLVGNYAVSSESDHLFIDDSFSQAHIISGTHSAGGLIGGTSAGAVINRSYAAAPIQSATHSSGGLVASLHPNGTVSGGNSYWDAEVSVDTSAGGFGTPETTTNMMQESTFEAWDFDEVWSIDEGQGYPGLNATPEPLPLPSLGPPIEICDAQDLMAIDERPIGEYQLCQDIDLAGMEWTPLRTFFGHFDGQSYQISNFSIPEDNFHHGLFERLADAKVENVTIADVEAYHATLTGNLTLSELEKVVVRDAQVIGSLRIGGIVGRSDESIIRLSGVYDSMVAGSSPGVGGIVGSLDNSVLEESWSDAEVSGAGDSGFGFGGLVGRMLGSSEIVDSYSLSTVSGHTDVGGLVGYTSSSGLILRSFAAGAVSAEESAGGLIGYSIPNTNVVDSYWDIQATGQSSSGGGEGKTTAEMYQQDTYTGWDFINVWDIIDDGSYPWLQWEEEL